MGAPDSVVYFNFYPSDWRAGTNGLSPAEKGIYIDLLALMYEHGGPIQRDDERLARRCGATRAGFRKAVEHLIAERKIEQNSDGFLFNSRVAAELEKIDGRRKKASAGGNERWRRFYEEKQGPISTQAQPKQTSSTTPSSPQAPEKPPKDTCSTGCSGDANHKPSAIDHSNSTTLPPSSTVPPPRAQEPDRPPDGDLGGRVNDPLFEDLVRAVFTTAGFSLSRRSAKTDAWIANWAAQLPHAAIIRVVDERTRAMRSSGDPPRALKAFEDGLGREVERQQREADSPAQSQPDIAAIVAAAVKTPPGGTP